MTQLAMLKGGRIRTSYRSRLEWVPVNVIENDPRTQRRFDEAWAQKIATDFDPDKLGYPFVWATPLKGDRERFVVLDGQHRIAASKIALGVDQQIECEVVRGIDLAQAAALFRGRNTNRTVRLIDKFLTGVTAKDAECVAITRIVENLKLTVGHGGDTGTISAVGALQHIFRSEAEATRGKLLSHVLAFALATWGRDAPSFNGDVLKGLALLMARHAEVLDLDALQRKLAAMSGSALGLIGKARGAREHLGGSISQNVARTIVTVYNSGRGKHRLPSWDTKAA